MAKDDLYLPVINRAGRRVLLEESRFFTRSMELLEVRLAQDFLNLWAYSENMPWDRRIQYLTESLADLQLVYGDDATGLAAQYLQVMRDGEDLPTVLADQVAADRVGVSLRWALTNKDAQMLLYGALQRYFREPYRETIRQSAFAAGNGYARVPDAGACPFCLMLASRGAVYASKDAALKVGSGAESRKKGKQLAKARRATILGLKPDYGFHDRCRCDVVEVSENVGLPEANVQLYDMWQRTFWGDDYRDDPKIQHGLKAVTFETAYPTWENVIRAEGVPWMSTDPVAHK